MPSWWWGPKRRRAHRERARVALLDEYRAELDAIVHSGDIVQWLREYRVAQQRRGLVGDWSHLHIDQLVAQHAMARVEVLCDAEIRAVKESMVARRRGA